MRGSLLVARRAATARVVGPCRRFTRGIPYAPQGTIQDFTSSPRHVQLAEMQRKLDESAGRAHTGLYEGPTIATEEGARSLFPAGQTPNPRYTRRGGPSPAIPHLPQFAVPPVATAQMMPPRSNKYQQDLRSDPSLADTPEHVLAARQRVMAMQSDGYGDSPRGIVMPPPPLDPEAPRAYEVPRVSLDDTWWMLMWSFLFLFLVMARYGS